MPLTFILGGARSGKSRYAEDRAAALGGEVLFVATAEALDDDMRDRIARHRAERPADWRTLEAPTGVGAALADMQADTVVIDCVTLLVSNIILTLPDDATQAQASTAVMEEIEALLAAHQPDVRWLVISNEVGMGVVPPYRLGRLYRDALGRANQRIAAAADEVILLVAGLPWQLKSP